MTTTTMIKKAKRVFGYVATGKHDGHYLRLHKTDILYLLKDADYNKTFELEQFDLREDGNLYIN